MANLCMHILLINDNVIGTICLEPDLLIIKEHLRYY